MEINEEIFPKHENFQYSHVAFIDILGFGHKVKSIDSKERFHEVAKLLNAVRHVADACNKAEGILEGFSLTTISDSIIVSAPYTDPACTIGLIHILHEIQYELLTCGFKTLIRGFLSRGHVYNKDGFLFGEGYIKAYLGEQQIGFAPRIVISPELIKEAEATIGGKTSRKGFVSIFDFIKEDPSDGYYFIDYLKPVGAIALKDKKEIVKGRNEAKEVIISSLSVYSDNQKIRSKYKWLESYFDHTEQYFEQRS